MNPPSRLCGRCLADTTTLLQETGGLRRTAAAQSPMPVGVGRRLTGWRRWLLLLAVLLFALAQVVAGLALGESSSAPHPSPAPGERGRPGSR